MFVFLRLSTVKFLSCYNMMPRPKPFFIVLFCVLFTTTFSCHRNGLEVQKVEGVVTMNEKPLEGCTVMLHPKNSEGHVGYAITDKNGRFYISTWGATPDGGAEIGEYDVAFDKLVENPALKTQKRVIPEKYADIATSGFTANIQKGKNVFKFDLVSK